MMKISVKSMHFHMDAKLVAFIEKKLNRLNRLCDGTVEAEVHLKLDGNGPVHEKITEIRLLYPGGAIVDKRTGKSFEAAVTASVETLKRKLAQHKDKSTNHRRNESEGLRRAAK